ncbi:2,3-dimethylmalate lyase [Porphyridium purpureum]|uniref:2,3-dimethylmalate lyase n=1 Tax=Porphyridium purpureum TaxID=35688 RepID=A0A5J4YWZ7_PORPP|nr:2,3-dimethylmalate lyase [Porphyridium purpureum]|eukprot:POR2697..scf209_3
MSAQSAPLFGNVSRSRTPAQQLRDLLQRNPDEMLLMPCCYDGLSAKLVERAGFELTFMSGFSVAGSKGLPDTGLLSYEEMRQRVTEITSVISIPLIADADGGYGNAINVKRTIHGYAAAGAAGLLLEDQVLPKRCGHTRGKAVVSREEAISRMQAAVDARDAGSDIVIIGRTDAAACVSFEEALERARIFLELGADMTFVEAPRSERELAMYCESVGGMKLVNCLEGGDTPILPPQRLEELGFKLAAYPLSLLSSSIKAMEVTLAALRSGDPAGVEPHLVPFEDVRSIVGFDEYDKQQQRYKV